MNSSNTSEFSASELASLSVWRIPDVPVKSELGGLIEVQDSESLPIPVLTVDEIEAMQKQAYDEAFAQGKKDGYSQGFNEGSKQGYDENVQALQKKAMEFVSLLESLSQPFKVLDAEVEKELVKLAIGIATQIIRREIKLDPGQVIAAVREAINVLPLSSQKISLYLHPEDAELVRSALSLDDISTAWRIIEAPLITRGGCKVDTEISHIDATVENRLAAVITTIFGGERGHDCKDAEGTTPWTGAVESRLEQGPRAPTVGALGDAGAVADDCKDAEGRATQGAVAEDNNP
jgi:flagellar assembly protein FliH